MFSKNSFFFQSTLVAIHHTASAFGQDLRQTASHLERRLEEFFVGGDGVEDNLVLEEGSRGQCGLKTCHQYVTGRGLSYARALQIIQSEQFLDAVVDRRQANVVFRKKSLRQRGGIKRRRGRWRRQL